MSNSNEANLWAESVWRRAIKGWEARQQDYNYRRFLARPGMRDALRLLRPISNGAFLDLGCGDGSEMRHIRKVLAKQGFSGKFFGFDLQQSLIKIAKSKIRGKKPIETSFDFGQLARLISRHKLPDNVDLVFSTFLLQELSDADEYFKMSTACLKEGGQGIFLFLHPKFGEAMLRKNVVCVNDQLKSKSWRWAAEYPIVEEDGRTFYVPYFHRELEDYLRLARKYFSMVEFFEQKPMKKVIKKCESEKRSPFHNHLGNVYYPEIINIPSLLIFMVKK